MSVYTQQYIHISIRDQIHLGVTCRDRLLVAVTTDLNQRSDLDLAVIYQHRSAGRFAASAGWLAARWLVIITTCIYMYTSYTCI